MVYVKIKKKKKKKKKKKNIQCLSRHFVLRSHCSIFLTPNEGQHSFEEGTVF